MLEFLNRLPEIINKGFEVLELLLVRLTILVLAAIGAYMVVKNHP